MTIVKLLNSPQGQAAPGADADRPGRLLPEWAKVLVVVAHPDDESFGLGAIISQMTASGAAVHILTGQTACSSSTTPASPVTQTTRRPLALPCWPPETPGCRPLPGPCPPLSPSGCAPRPASRSPGSRPTSSTCASGWTGPGNAEPPSPTPARSLRQRLSGGGGSYKATASTCAGCCHHRVRCRRRLRAQRPRPVSGACMAAPSIAAAHIPHGWTWSRSHTGGGICCPALFSAIV